eukprot:gene281-302_t
MEMLVASQQDIEQCQFAQWYNLFRNVSIKSVIIPLSSEFVSYLTADGVFIPVSSTCLDHDHLSDEEGDDVETAAVDDDNETDNEKQYSFPEIESSISTALKEFDHKVFVKLNWSAPLDAVWMNGGSMLCRSAHDVFLLIKSSDRVAFDLERMFELIPNATVTVPQQPTLVLRKWANLHPSMEFRVFIYNGALLGISQRHCHTYFDFLEAELPGLVDSIERFWQQEVKNRAPLLSYQKKRVWLIDFNPFGAPTCPLLFDWGDFVGLDKLETRIVESRDEVLPSTIGSTRGPADVHLSADFPRFMEICKQQRNEPLSDEED